MIQQRKTMKAERMKSVTMSLDQVVDRLSEVEQMMLERIEATKEQREAQARREQYWLESEKVKNQGEVDRVNEWKAEQREKQRQQNKLQKAAAEEEARDAPNLNPGLLQPCLRPDPTRSF